MRKSRIEKLLEKFPFATKEFLHNLYIVEEKSLPEIHKSFGMDFRATKDLMAYYNLPLRTISQSRLTKTGKQKILSGFVNKYGVENPSQLPEVKEKKKKTFLARYGVDNIWKSPEYYKWLDDYMLLTYGVKRIAANPWGWRGAGQKRREERLKKLWSGRDSWWASLTDEEKSKIAAEACSGNTSASSLETRVMSSLSRLHINFTPHFVLQGRNFDFRVFDRTLIEVNGDFWHANPKKYKADDIINLPANPVKASELWEKDRKKEEIAKKNGYKVITIWESDISNVII